MARLSYQARKKLPKSSFVFPGKDGFPINDLAHARAALQAAGGARTGKPLPPAKAARVRAAVRRRYPSIGQRQKRKAFGG